MAPSAEPDLRRHILDTTRRLLVRDGYAGLSMRKIARAVGFSATSLYLYFENKDDLFHALIDEGMAQLHAAMQEVGTAQDEDPVERLMALCRCYIDFGLRQPEYYEVMFVLHAVGATRYPAEKYRRARRSLDLIVDTLDAGARQGVFDLDDARLVASTIWAVLHGTVSLLLSRRLDAGLDPDVFVEATLQQTIRGLVPIESWTTIST